MKKGEDKNKQPPKAIFPRIEEDILLYWKKNDTFKKILKASAKKKPFVFYEGPPYANGKPGIHHVLARAYKDVILRFKTMQGYSVPRKAGWDTHGLPVEMEVEKKLDVHSKKEIEKIGLETFVETARESVFGYKKDHEEMTRRMGFWLDLEHAYVTMTNEYIAGLWCVFAEIAKNGYLYRDYKVLPWCPRCETSLSSHEVAQAYKRVTDTAIYVKFRVQDKKKDSKTYFLAWTTTPWTLPGNMFLAVHPKATYVTAEKEHEKIILADGRLSVLGDGWKVVNKQKGKDLAGATYAPLYESGMKDKKAGIYTVVSADFVTTDDGTGIVHIAPAFGADDMAAFKKQKIGMSALVTVNENGTMKTPDYPWDKKLFQDANPLIIEELKKNGLLFRKESYEHDYPHCWRCKSALMYYAKDSWFLQTTAVKDVMQKENEKIKWHPEFVGKNRLGEWLRENIDWAISRERYWGMPLPIWRCQISKSKTQNPKSETSIKSQNKKARAKEGCGNYMVVSSLAELDMHAYKDKTRLYVMRHGEATHNKKGIVGPPTPSSDKNNALTKQGEREAKKAARALKGKIDVVVSSPLRRTKETARIVSRMLGDIPMEVEKSIHDIDVGDFVGKTVKEVNAIFPRRERIEKPFPNGESMRDVRIRMMSNIKDILARHKGKRILVISHGDPLWELYAAMEGKSGDDYFASWYPKTGEVKKLRLHNWPYSFVRGELDFHRPYIDEIKLQCKTCKGEMTRIPDVADVWFDSGAMPFAQNETFCANMQKSPPKADPPLAKKIKMQHIGKIIDYPADYITEGIDQTRGWFYTLLAVSSLLRLPAPYKHVITVGLVLDAQGEKMSKSRGNTINPFLLFERYGADAVRWYFYTVNQPWDEKLFDERDVQSASRKFLMIFWNVFQYWDGIQAGLPMNMRRTKPASPINQWLLARMRQVTEEVTAYLEAYDVVRAARTLEEFVGNDISRWYVRRIRDTAKLGTKEEKREIASVLGDVLHGTSLITAPFIPFMSDAVALQIRAKQSVHALQWPKSGNISAKERALLRDMKRTRGIVSTALQERAIAGMKVRQPLAELKIKNQESRIKKNAHLQDLMKGEVNVKNVIFGAKIKKDVELDTDLTPELKQEGAFRDLVRSIQQLRKDAGLTPKEKIEVHIGADEKGKKVVRMFQAHLKKEVHAGKIVLEAPTHQLFMRSSLHVGDYYFEIGIRK